MLSRKTLGVAGAAILGTGALLGTNSANAVIDLDATDKSAAHVTYARETLGKGVGNVVEVTNDDDTKTTYHVVSGAGNILDVKVELGIPVGALSTVEVEFVFENMAIVDATTLVATIDGNATVPWITTDNSQSFRLTHATALTDDVVVDLTVPSIAISGDAPGSIIMNAVAHDDLRENPTHSESWGGAVVAKSGVVETAIPKDAIAAVENLFKSFWPHVDGSPVLMANLGSFTVAEGDALSAATGVAPVAGTVLDFGTDGTAPATGDSSVTISGDFSFASKVTLDAAAGCTTTVTADLLLRDPADTTVVTDTTKLKAVSPATIVAASNLCIHVVDPDGENAVVIPIPDTDKYMVATSYAAGTTDAAFPPEDGGGMLGRIMRNGTTVQLPYLSTYEGYNQRIVLSNRGSTDAPYEITFRPEDGVTATAGMNASGTLAGESTTTLSLVNDNVVTLADGSRTAATIVLEAEPRNIDVSTVLVNKSDGSTDTVVLQ